MHNTINLFNFLGWQGGTIHQVACATGCSAHDLIYKEIGQLENYQKHLYIWGLNWKNENLFIHGRLKQAETHYGYLEFWLGVRDAK